MEKRFVAAFALSIVILLGWSLISKRLFPPPPPQAAPSAPAATAPAPTPPPVAGTEPAAPPAPTGAAVAEAAEQQIRLDTDLAEIVLTNRGGRVRSWRLKPFESAGRAVDFVSDAARREDLLPLALVFDDRAILPEVNAALFAVSRTEDPAGRTHIEFRWSDGAGSEVVKSFVFHSGEPLVDVDVSAV